MVEDLQGQVQRGRMDVGDSALMGLKAEVFLWWVVFPRVEACEWDKGDPVEMGFSQLNLANQSLGDLFWEGTCALSDVCRSVEGSAAHDEVGLCLSRLVRGYKYRLQLSLWRLGLFSHRQSLQLLYCCCCYFP